MIKITWMYEKTKMVDYYFLKYFQLSSHFKGAKFWGYEFHWKNSRTWYYNFKRHKAMSGQSGFQRTRLTIRFGSRLLVIAKPVKTDYYKDVEVTDYYKDVEVIEVVVKGTKVFPLKTKEVFVTSTPLRNYQCKFYEYYELLSKDYPSNTWRN